VAWNTSLCSVARFGLAIVESFTAKEIALILRADSALRPALPLASRIYSTCMICDSLVVDLRSSQKSHDAEAVNHIFK
jgi:hypothetical protein